MLQTDVVVGTQRLMGIDIDLPDNAVHHGGIITVSIQLVHIHKRASLCLTGTGVDGGMEHAGVFGVRHIELGMDIGESTDQTARLASVVHLQCLAGAEDIVQMIGELVLLVDTGGGKVSAVIVVDVKHSLLVDRVIDNRTLEFIVIQVAEISHGNGHILTGFRQGLDHILQRVLHGSCTAVLIIRGSLIDTHLVEHGAGEVHDEDQVNTPVQRQAGGGKLNIGNAVFLEFGGGGGGLLVHAHIAALASGGIIQLFITFRNDQGKAGEFQLFVHVDHGQIFVGAGLAGIHPVAVVPQQTDSHISGFTVDGKGNLFRSLIFLVHILGNGGQTGVHGNGAHHVIGGGIGIDLLFHKDRQRLDQRILAVGVAVVDIDVIILVTVDAGIKGGVELQPVASGGGSGCIGDSHVIGGFLHDDLPEHIPNLSLGNAFLHNVGLGTGELEFQRNDGNRPLDGRLGIGAGGVAVTGSYLIDYVGGNTGVVGNIEIQPIVIAFSGFLAVGQFFQLGIAGDLGSGGDLLTDSGNDFFLRRAGGNFERVFRIRLACHIDAHHVDGQGNARNGGVGAVIIAVLYGKGIGRRCAGIKFLLGHLQPVVADLGRIAAAGDGHFTAVVISNGDILLDVVKSLLKSGSLFHIVSSSTAEVDGLNCRLLIKLIQFNTQLAGLHVSLQLGVGIVSFRSIPYHFPVAICVTGKNAIIRSTCSVVNQINTGGNFFNRIIIAIFIVHCNGLIAHKRAAIPRVHEAVLGNRICCIVACNRIPIGFRLTVGTLQQSDSPIPGSVKVIGIVRIKCFTSGIIILLENPKHIIPVAVIQIDIRSIVKEDVSGSGGDGVSFRILRKGSSRIGRTGLLRNCGIGHDILRVCGTADDISRANHRRASHRSEADMLGSLRRHFVLGLRISGADQILHGTHSLGGAVVQVIDGPGVGIDIVISLGGVNHNALGRSGIQSHAGHFSVGFSSSHGVDVDDRGFHAAPVELVVLALYFSGSLQGIHQRNKVIVQSCAYNTLVLSGGIVTVQTIDGLLVLGIQEDGGIGHGQ